MDIKQLFEAWFSGKHPPYINPNKEEVDWYEHKRQICREAFESGYSFCKAMNEPEPDFAP